MAKVWSMLVAGILSLASFCHPSGADARVDVNIVLPPLVISSPPEVVVIPGTYAYFVPGVETDIFFYHGYWYRPHAGRWYRASGYNGPWVRIVAGKVPGVLLSLPPDFRHLPPGHQRIPYGHFKKHWRTWEREKYWDRHHGREFRREDRREHREERREHRDDRGRGR
jgi:hypothetical protein